MSNDDMSVITQPAGQRVLALRESYLAICDGDKCEAHLLNANERWYTYKLKERQQARHRNKTAIAGGEVPEADESLWVFNSAAQWVDELLGIYDEKTIRKKLASLVARGFLATRQNPTRKWDRKPQWMFLRSNVQAAVDAWAASRPAPDLDPSEADEEGQAGAGPDGQDANADQDNSGAEGNTNRENARMDSGEVPNGFGKITDSSRENARSNTTGISHRDPSQESSSGGEYNLTSNARARAAQPVTPPAPEARFVPSTTTDASLEKAGTISDQLTGVAVMSPDGEAAHAASTEPDFPFEEDLQLLGSLNDDATSTENVPGGAELDLEAMYDLAPHDPEDTRAVLSPALGGPRKLSQLLDETPPGLREGDRHRWLTQITPDRARELVKEGRATGGHPWTAIMQLLDREIGATVTRGSGHHVDCTPNGNAFAPARKPEPVEVTDPKELNAKYLGSWQLKAAPDRLIEVVRVEERPGNTPLFHLAAGDPVTMADLVLKYRRPDLEASA